MSDCNICGGCGWVDGDGFGREDCPHITIADLETTNKQLSDSLAELVRLAEIAIATDTVPDAARAVQALQAFIDRPRSE